MTRDIELDRRRVLGSLGAIGAASALGGAGTMAYFSDQETYTNNEFVAGALDLKVDWQEHYNGAPVEAYPDPDDDGVQDSFAAAPGQTTAEGVGYVCEDGADTSRDMDPRESLRTLSDDTIEVVDGTEEPAPLVSLGDVKPGDSGELTLSFHLCDNPGYVWFSGALLENAENGLSEPEAHDPDEDGGAPGELADAVLTRLWYDDDCDNVLDGGETPLTPVLSLAELLAVLETDRGIPLDGVRGDDGGNADPPSLTPGTCPETTYDSLHQTGDTVTVDGQDHTIGMNPKCTDFGLVEVLKVGPGEDDGELPGDGNSETYQTDYGDVQVSQSGQTITWRTDSSPNGSFDAGEEGFCVSKVVVKGGNEGGNVYSYDNDDGDDDFDDADPTRSSGETRSLQTPTGQDISHVSFCVDLVADGGDGEDGRDCFENSTTHCLGLSWWLPPDHANELQTDSVRFDLGFYTEQCRHNDGSGLPPANGG